MACVGTIFMGMQAKCMVLTHRYGLILKRSFSSPACDFPRMNRELREAFIQHQEYMRHLKLLKCLVVKTLFQIHCYSVVCIGALFYITRNIGMNFFSACVVATTTTMLLEYLFWCHMADTLQEAADSLGSAVFELCARMPHSREYHSQYVGLRASLMIVSINCTGKQMSMDCYGLFEISTIAFVDLLHTGYAVMMFLKSID
ncbi:hypothetical protein RP20_CCG013214 [Aedes albopictus]|nr:hypothetical protein RP20_CCG013214 [Aedes albopictus]